MNLNKIRPKNQTEDLLLSITKICETLIKQNKLTQSHKKFWNSNFPNQQKQFILFPPITIEVSRLSGLRSLEVYSSIFNIIEKNNKSKLYKFPDEKSGGVSYEKVKDEIEKDLDISDITAADLQTELKGPMVFAEFREQVKKGRRMITI